MGTTTNNLRLLSNKKSKQFLFNNSVPVRNKRV